MAALTTTDHTISCEGHRLFAREWSPSLPTAHAPIILLHDSLGCVDLWRDFPERLCLATSRRVVAYDRLGFGRSDPRSGSLPLDFITAECARSLPPILGALGIQNFALFGHSVGGGMGIAGAAHFAARCEALVTVSAQVFAEAQIYEGIRAAKIAFAKSGPHYERLKKYHGDKTDWVLSAWIDTWLSPAFSDFSLASFIREVRCPVVAIHGARDEYGSPAQARMICELAAGTADLQIFPDCGHIPHREQPDAVLDAVNALLRT